MRWLVPILSLLLSVPVWAQADPVDIVAQILAQTDAPGAGVALLTPEGTQIAVGGLRALGHPELIEQGDLWHIGSDTKSMTATLVARLVEAGVIEWSDTVGEVLGESIPNMDPAYRDIDYGTLLRHRSGLPANLGLWDTLQLTGLAADRNLMIDRAVYAASVLAEPSGPVGEYAYSNAGYVVVGAMLEASTGQPWEALIREQVFDPVGMASAGFGPPGTIGVIDQPRGHSAGLLRPLHPVEPDKDADNIPALGPAGTVHLSLADMMLFLHAHATRDPAFLSLESWALLQTPLQGQDYAMGWGFMPDGALRHAGSNTMWYALMIVQPDTGRAAFAAVNYADADRLRAVLTPLLQAELAR